MSDESFIKSFWAKHKKLLLVLLVLYLALMAGLLLMSSGPQSEPFLYQVF